MVAEKQVTVFGLYGEEKPEDEVEFFHIEKISTRSSQYDWQIKPHVHHGMFQILFLSAGEAQVHIDGNLYKTTAPAVICLPGNVVHGFQFLPGSEGWVLTVGETLLTETDPRARMLIAPLMLAPLRLQLSPGDSQAALIGSVLAQIYDEFNLPRLGRGAMFDWMLRIILLTIRRLQEEHVPKAPANRARHGQFQRFRSLMEAHYKAHWPVEAYAGELGMPPARLNRICRTVTGKTAGALIQDRLTLEAQRLLTYTNASAAMVASELGFQDPAYFARFFKRRTGLSPIGFRNEQTREAG
ncbi:MAG: helix-turn-helix domain-containing protein [Maritimibacter sp.]